MILKKTITTVFFILIFTILQHGSSVLLDISGNYLFYSYDHNYILGRGNIIVKYAGFDLRGTSIEIDVKNRSLLLTTLCKVNISGQTEKSCDMIRSDLNKMSIILYKFGEKIQIISLAGIIPSSDFIRKRRKLLNDSLLYFIGKRFQIKNNFGLTGFDVTVFIEGTQSLSFKKFKMDKGISRKSDLLSINNLWYTNRSGLITDVSFNYNKDKSKIKLSSHEFIKFNYDIFKVRSDSPKPDLNIGSETTLGLSKSSSLLLKGSYISGNSGQALLKWNFKPGRTVSSFLTLDYRDKPERGSDLWIRSGMGMDLKKAGRVNIRYNHEKDLGYSGDISYSNKIGKSFSLSAKSGISAVKVSDSILNKISDSSLSINYSNNAFNISANYSLNRDLINDNYRYSPGLSINTRPVNFYGNLLTLNFSSSLLFSKVIRKDLTENSFRSNTTISVSGKHLNISKNIFIDLSGRIEQFFDKDPLENFTTAGIVLRNVHKFSENASLEILYNFLTRRGTRNWMITGTSTGDLSARAKFRTSDMKLAMISSVSYDTERSEYKTGFFNLKYNLIKYWNIQSFFNYDFEFDRISYIIFLERQAGRILLRTSYRSISKQFQLEIIPR